MTLLTLHNAFWPFERTNILRHKELQYSLELGNYGQFQFQVPATREGLEGIVPGALIGIRSSLDLPNFAGFVDRIEERQTEGTVAVSGREWTAILNERNTKQDVVYPTGSSGDIANDIIRRASARNPTGLRIIPASLAPPIITAFTVRADRVLQALTNLSVLSGGEWLVTYTVGQNIIPRFQWRSKVGQDIRTTVHVVPAEADYMFDIVTGVQLLQAMSSTGDVSSRASAAVIRDQIPAIQDTTTTRVQVTSAQLGKRRQKLGVATSREAVLIAATAEDGLSAARIARQVMHSLAAGMETISATISTRYPWRYFRLGNTITLHLAGLPAVGQNTQKVLRIMGMQAKESVGIVELVGKTVYDAPI